MRSPGEIVLLLPGHTKGRRQPVRRVSHSFIGRKLSYGWKLGGQEVGTKLREQSELCTQRFCLGSFEHELSHLPGVSDWNVGHELDSTRHTYIVNTSNILNGLILCISKM